MICLLLIIDPILIIQPESTIALINLFAHLTTPSLLFTLFQTPSSTKPCHIRFRNPLSAHRFAFVETFNRTPIYFNASMQNQFDYTHTHSGRARKASRKSRRHSTLEFSTLALGSLDALAHRANLPSRKSSIFAIVGWCYACGIHISLFLSISACGYNIISYGGLSCLWSIEIEEVWRGALLVGNWNS